jgi:hypothetical protein
MSVLKKGGIIFVGCGLSAVCTYLTTIYPLWATALGGAQMALLASVSVLTGFPKTVE